MINNNAADVTIKKSKVSGVILIDKPKGLTSQQVVSKVKYLFKSPVHDSKKAGHTGTLDPMATGLLPVCLGEATKFSHYQLDADKSYQATIKLGVRTDTGDAEGSVIETSNIPTLTQANLDKVATMFMGDIQQTPPMYSALKKDGKKLYEYARAGIEVERPSRPITIKALLLKLGEAGDEINLEVTCSKGTYVRVLGEDIANALDTVGHLTALRRTQVGHFKIDAAIGLEAFASLPPSDRFLQLLAIDACIEGLPSFTVSDTEYARLNMGQRLNVKEQMSATLETYISTYKQKSKQQHNLADTIDIRLQNSEGEFLGLGKLAENGRLQPKKMIQVN